MWKRKTVRNRSTKLRVGSKRIVQIMPLRAQHPARKFKQNLTALHTTLIRLALQIPFLNQNYFQLPKPLHQMDQHPTHHSKSVANSSLFFNQKDSPNISETQTQAVSPASQKHNIFFEVTRARMILNLEFLENIKRLIA